MNSTRSDLARLLPGWLREARGLADGHRLDAVAAALGSLAAQRGRPTFRVAVVGEFNRGKSTLVNTVIERELLPTGQLPGTLAEVAVRGVEQVEALRLTWPDGRRQTGALDRPDLWRDLVDRPAPSDGTDAGPARPGNAVAEVAGTWLTGLNLELVDTPGVNDGGTDGYEQLRRSVSAADGALFVVSALSPLGTTERGLLAEELLCRHLPHIAVVVTMLDRVDEGDRDGVLTGLRERLGALPGRGALPVLAAPEPGGQGPRLADLRELIGGWAGETDRGRWRDRRIAAGTADHCDGMTRLAAEAMAAARLSEADQRRRAEQAAADRAEDERVWDELRIDVGARRLATAQQLRDVLYAERDDILDKLREELATARDPHAWWQHELPARIRWHLSVAARSAESTLLTRLAGDGEWLDTEVRRRQPAAGPSPRPAALRLNTGQRAGGSAPPVKDDLDKLRIAARVGAQGGAAIGYLIAAARHARLPVIYSLGFSVLSSVIAEAAIRSAIEAQRQRIDALLVQTVDDIIATFAKKAAATADELYRDVVEHLHDCHRAWRESYVDVLGAGAGQEQTVDWTALATAAASLASRIRAELTRSVSDLSEKGN
ncbi:dynamin family protein [Actinophytocola oryzae]|uniref:Dynamin family protein n=1 Tax=Actinophytocola oryzae TaxID=502181 RepID=A0A4R7URG0_9PSEU|nr:dynamin family protein [Actinophytocola oryzae]TDV35426.1 dynamin family protein [Actinophytocola oryzae]